LSYSGMKNPWVRNRRSRLSEAKVIDKVA
jgi:hypothetical protein